jgi:sialic acid synthase SpsE/sugar phosphate isomerase/epimerase
MIIKKNLYEYLVPVGTSVKKALQQLNLHKLRFLLCVDNSGRLCGILSLGDVNRWLISDVANSLEASVLVACQRNPNTVIEGAPPKEIELLLTRFAYVPILDRDKRPIGLALRRHLQNDLQISQRRIAHDAPAFVIAEIGNNHNGSLDLAKKLIDLARDSGADCAKFQMRDLGSLYINSGDAGDARQNLGSQYTLDLLSRFQLSPDALFKAFDYCKSVGLIPLCTPWDERSVIFLEQYGITGYKVASADLTNHGLLKILAGKGKPLICSTGMSRESEILEAVKLLRREGAAYALLHCNSTYPAPFKDVNLKYMDRLRQIGECEVGYSGHERDIFIVVAAVSLGARIIEKHFTLDREMEGNDHKCSLLPDEFRRMVEGIRQVEEAMGNTQPRELSQGELINRVSLAKSIFIDCDLARGQEIEHRMLVVKSPGHGLQPNRIKELVGRSTSRPMKRGDVFYPSDLEDLRPEPREYSFKSRWGLPVRHHDYRELLSLSNMKLLEFHFSYKDLELDHEKFFPSAVPVDLIVHAPELFSGDHTLDLASPDYQYRMQSVREMRRVINVVRSLRCHFSNSNQPIGIITNVGGFSQHGQLSKWEIKDRLLCLRESLAALTDPSIDIWPQTMPPFPWHFGGQRFHNLFVDADEIVEFCSDTNMRVCLDVSHSSLACNFGKRSFQRFLEAVLPFSAHLHIADASGVDSEGLQIGDGEIDFYALGEAIKKYAPYVSWIPEVWQGHENQGEGFWLALQRLENEMRF